MEDLKRILKENKKAVILALAIFGLILLISILVPYLKKGTLQVSVSASDGPVKVQVLDLGGEKVIPEGVERDLHHAQYPEVYSTDQRSFKLKLKSGQYLVTSSLATKTSFSDEDTEVKSEKVVTVESRKTENLNLTIQDQPKLTRIEATDRTSYMNFSNDRLYTVSSYGVVTSYDLKNNNQPEVVRSEPANLRRIRSFCNFSNGVSLGIDFLGRIYKIEGAKSTIIDIPQNIDADNIYENLAAISEFRFNSTSLICTKDYQYLLGAVRIDKDFNFEQVTSSIADLSKFSNYQRSGEDVFLYNSSEENISSELDNEDKLNSVVLSSPDSSEAKELDLGSQPTALSATDSGKFCYTLSSKVTCRESIDSPEASFEKDLKDYVEDIQMLSDDRVAYIAGDSIWILNLEDGTSRNILNSDEGLAPLALTADLQSGVLAFATTPANFDSAAVGGPNTNYNGESRNNIFLLSLEDL